jgi:hypothetical protein
MFLNSWNSAVFTAVLEEKLNGGVLATKQSLRGILYTLRRIASMTARLHVAFKTLLK